MSYEYDGNGGLQPAPPKKNDNDLGAWIFIAVMFAVAWAWLLLGELPGPAQLVGGLVLVVGVAAVQYGSDRDALAPAPDVSPEAAR